MLRWLRSLFHKHDFEIEFISGSTVDYCLVCKCGERALDMNDALQRQGR
jgi:hypothetical protein